MNGQVDENIDEPQEGVEAATRVRLAIHEHRTGGVVVYAMFIEAMPGTTSKGDNQIQGVFRSPDRGAAGSRWASPWVEGDRILDPGGQGTSHNAIVADPNDPNVIYLGGDRKHGEHLGVFGHDINNPPEGNLAKGTWNPSNNTTLWDSIVEYAVGEAVTGRPHADTRTLVAAHGNLYTGDDGGIYRLNNPILDDDEDDPEWYSLIGNMQISEVVTVAYNDEDNVLLAGLQDNGTVLQPDEGELEWEQIGGGDGNYVRIRGDDYYYATQNLAIVHPPRHYRA